MKASMHFAHANGLPSASYQKMFQELEKHYRVSFLPKFSHHPKYPVTNNWGKLKQQLIASIEQQANEPIIGIGHSLGGALNLMASLERPDLFKAVVMLDVPTMNLFESMVVRLAKATGYIDKLTPAERTKMRRTQWPDKQTAMDYFRSRKMFANFDSDCLNAYVDDFNKDEQSGLSLSFELPIELAIYRTIPDNLHVNRDDIKVPTGVLVGDRTNTVTPNQYRRMKAKLGLHGMRVPGSHMFPLEQPIETAHHIRQLLHKMGVN